MTSTSFPKTYQVALILILITQTLTYDVPKNSQVYSCKIFDYSMHPAREYIGRVFLDSHPMPTIRIFGYEKNQPYSKGIFIAYQFQGVDSGPAHEFPNQPTNIKELIDYNEYHYHYYNSGPPYYNAYNYPAISKEFKRLGGDLKWSKGGKQLSAKEYHNNTKMHISFQLKSQHPFLLENFIEQLSLSGKIKGRDGNFRQIYMGFSNWKKLNNRGWGLALSIIGLAVPFTLSALLLLFVIFFKKEKVAFFVSGFSDNTLDFLTYVTLITFGTFIPFVKLFPWPVIFLVVPYLIFILSIILSARKCKTTDETPPATAKPFFINLFPKLFKIIFWALALAAGVLLIIFKLNWLVWYNMGLGHLVLIMDTVAACRQQKFHQLRIFYPVLLILAFQVSLISFIGYPENIWYIPITAPWRNVNLFVCILCIPPALILIFSFVLIPRMIPKSSQLKQVSVTGQLTINNGPRGIDLDKREKDLQEEVRKNEEELKKKQKELKDVQDLKQRRLQMDIREIGLQQREEALSRRGQDGLPPVVSVPVNPNLALHGKHNGILPYPNTQPLVLGNRFAAQNHGNIGTAVPLNPVGNPQRPQAAKGDNVEIKDIHVNNPDEYR